MNSETPKLLIVQAFDTRNSVPVYNIWLDPGGYEYPERLNSEPFRTYDDAKKCVNKIKHQHD